MRTLLGLGYAVARLGWCPRPPRGGPHLFAERAGSIDRRTGTERPDHGGLAGPWICWLLGDGQAGCRVPAQDVQDVAQVRRHLVQHHARAGLVTAQAGLITARGGGQDDEGPQPGDVAVLHAATAEVMHSGPGGDGLPDTVPRTGRQPYHRT